MKAVVYAGPGEGEVREVEDPRIEEPLDAVLRVTSSGICGSDLHMYEARTATESGTVMSHEIMGIVDQIGDAVRSIRVGDRVVLPFNIVCGFCYNCTRGHYN